MEKQQGLFVVSICPGSLGGEDSGLRKEGRGGWTWVSGDWEAHQLSPTGSVELQPLSGSGNYTSHSHAPVYAVRSQWYKPYSKVKGNSPSILLTSLLLLLCLYKLSMFLHPVFFANLISLSVFYLVILCIYMSYHKFFLELE